MSPIRSVRPLCLALAWVAALESVGCAGAGSATPPPHSASDENHRRAAENYLAQLDKEILAESYLPIYLEELGEESSALDEQERSTLKAKMVEVLGSEEVKRHLVELYLVRFTQSELEELARFYQTPTGKKLLQEAPEVMDASARIASGALAARLPREKDAEAAPSEEHALEVDRPRRLDEDGVPLAPSSVAKPPPNATCTTSGLCYLFLRRSASNERRPNSDSRVTVHYTGWTRDGTRFDSSVARGRPATFGVHQVIKGWTEALQLMPEGSILRVWIPPELAYGETPMRPGAPAGQLTFDIQLLQIRDN